MTPDRCPITQRPFAPTPTISGSLRHDDNTLHTTPRLVHSFPADSGCIVWYERPGTSSGDQLWTPVFAWGEYEACGQRWVEGMISRVGITPGLVRAGEAFPDLVVATYGRIFTVLDPKMLGRLLTDATYQDLTAQPVSV